MARCTRGLAVLAVGCAALVGGQAESSPQGLPPSGASAAAAAHRPHRNLPVSAIQLVPPDTSVALLSQVPATITVQCRYEGTGTLVFSLGESPLGMTIEPETGILSWTPPVAAEGSEVDVRVRAADGTSAGEVAFTLRVAAPTPIATSLAESTVTVTQAGTLHGLAFTLPAQTSVPPAQIAVATFSAAQAPPIPDGVTRVSDFFRVTPVQATGEMITITMPTSGLPAGRQPQDLRLFVYSDAAGNVEDGDDASGPLWIRTWYDLDVLPSGKVTVKLMGLGGLSFIGLEAPVAPLALPPGLRVFRTRVGTLAVTTTCAARVQGNGVPDPNCQVCAITGDLEMTVTVKHFARLHANPAATVGDLLSWLVAARLWFAARGLSSDPAFEVVVEQMPQASWLGFVTTNNLEDRRVLHITRAPEAQRLIQGTAVHEYFHHAQSRTRVAGKTNLMDGGKERNWLVEGTARWFEDELFDGLDTYRDLNHSPLRPVLEVGLAASPTAANATPASWEYDRFAFWKLIQSHCPGFSLPQVLNVDGALDPRGLKNFKSGLESAEWQCDFVSGLGDAYRSTLAGALHHYAVATQRANDITMLDLDEKPFPFEEPSTIVADAACAPDNCPAQSKRLVRLPPASVASFRVNDVPTLGPHDQVVLRFKPSFGTSDAIVWIVDDDDPNTVFGGTTLSLAAPVEHRYGEGRASRAFVTLINPSDSKIGEVEVQAQIRDTATAPFIGNLAYQPGDLLKDVTFQITTAGTVTGPKGLRLERTAADYWTKDQIHFTAYVPATPATIEMIGTIEALPNTTSGRVDRADGSYSTFVLSNPHLGGDIGCSGSGNSFTMTVPDWVDWDTDRYCRVYWDTVETRYDKDGKVVWTGPYGGAEMGEVKIEVLHVQP